MYVLDEDKVIIVDWAKKKNASISFRAAGEDTLRCLERGAGAKPHEILDKTLKIKAGNSDADRRHNEKVRAFMDGFGGSAVSELLMGLVGHWTAEKIDGIYLTKLGESKFQGCAMGRNNQNKPYLLLDTEAQRDQLNTFYAEHCGGTESKKEYFFSRLFFSGDYDVHDMLQAGKPIPTNLDIELMKELQKDLLVGRRMQLADKYNLSDADFAEETPADYQRVQHGPQANYVAQMLNENRLCKTADELNVLVNAVAAMSPPVIIYDGKAAAYQWRTLDNDQDIINYYEGVKGNTVKDTWKDQEARDSMIRWTIKNAIYLEYFDKGVKEIKPSELPDLLSSFKEVYGGGLTKYINDTLVEMEASGIVRRDSAGNYVKI